MSLELDLFADIPDYAYDVGHELHGKMWVTFFDGWWHYVDTETGEFTPVELAS